MQSRMLSRTAKVSSSTYIIFAFFISFVISDRPKVYVCNTKQSQTAERIVTQEQKNIWNTGGSLQQDSYSYLLCRCIRAGP